MHSSIIWQCISKKVFGGEDKAVDWYSTKDQPPWGVYIKCLHNSKIGREDGPAAFSGIGDLGMNLTTLVCWRPLRPPPNTFLNSRFVSALPATECALILLHITSGCLPRLPMPALYLVNALIRPTAGRLRLQVSS